MDWDQLRFFLELARAGRLVIAARRLEVDHTTVSRKVQALEKKLGITLFLREPDGYKLTEAGKASFTAQNAEWAAFSRAVENILGDA